MKGNYDDYNSLRERPLPMGDYGNVRTQQISAAISGLLLLALASSACDDEKKAQPTAAHKGEVAPAPPQKPTSRIDSDPDPEITEVTYSSQQFAEHVKLSAVVDATPLRPGDEFRVAVIFAIDEGWHIYGNPIGPGVGRPTTVKTQNTQQAVFGPARYAPGHKAEQDFGEDNKTWVWESTGRVVHYMTGHLADDAKPGRARFLLNATAQACTESECLPAKITIPLTVEIAASGTTQTKDNDNDFKNFNQSSVPAKEDS